VAPTALLASLGAALFLGYAAFYALLCAVAGFGTCTKCAGRGHKPTARGKRGADCRRCRGTGKRVRYGRKAWTYFRRLHREGTR
jgi:hypothetical protein